MATIPSPCISLCQMDAAGGLCTGCWRTMDEIIAWGALEDAAKLQVLGQIAQRKVELVFSPKSATQAMPS
jgi:uncharacterized protein